MNTNQLKRFAQEARIKLLKQVEAKLSFVLTADTPELREKTEQVKQLKDELNKTGKAQLIEKVAYTWFNRLMALRFMDANDYQPLGIRIITPKDGYVTPELLDEAKLGNIPDELKLNRQRVLDLLDNRITSKNPQNEAYKELLIAACNHLHSTLPFLFEKISDYSELLLPDDLTSDFSIVTDFRNGIQKEDCENVEVVGWLYQFYISQKKDEVFASKSTIKKEDIPAATQLFTPRWIVEYMVQNTVGKLWIQNRPKSSLRKYMPFFIESASLSSEDYLKINSPEDIRLLDPASGSGHILVYGFDLFTKIYEEEGYNTNDIPKLIIEKNLFGYEIDERAAQLSGFALMMKAREYQRRVLKKDIKLNILCFRDLQLNESELKDIIKNLPISVSEELLHDLLLLTQATNFGSLIVPKASSFEIVQLLELLKKHSTNSDVFQRYSFDALQTALEQLDQLADKFHCIVANPPYMSSGSMNNELSEFVKNSYPDSKADLMACFMERGISFLNSKGFLGMINQHSWMFLSSFEALRKKFIQNTFFDSILHLGARTFPEIGGEVVQNTSFCFWNTSFRENGRFLRLTEYNSSDLKKNKVLESINSISSKFSFCANQEEFLKIPSCQIAYWVTNEIVKLFENCHKMSEYGTARMGLATGNNFKFVRYWHETSVENIGFKFESRNKALLSKKKWFPYSKGGAYRKWYGNNDYVVNWSNDGEEIQTTMHPSGKRIWAHNFNLEYIFKPSITYALISTENLSVRYNSQGFLFDGTGTCVFFKEESSRLVSLGLANSNIVKKISEILNPTLAFQAGDFGNIPFEKKILEFSLDDFILNNLVLESKLEWDSKESSYDFLKNELLRIKGQDLEETYDLYQQYWRNKFFQLHKNEEELNRQFIEIYGLQEELTPDVSLEDVTILKEETSIKNGELVFNAKEVFAQFMSYAVGCMFGRYSLDKEGLILANQGETLEDYLHKIERTLDTCSFLPDADNIIPILDEEWFEDDIVARFHKFLKVTFGEDNFSKNLAFVEEQLGKDIRKYFTKDFYSDHIKRYKKRLIYWMFSSPKGSFNVLIYMHRYNPDTVSNILNKYLREFSGKLKTRLETLEHIKVSGTASEKTKAIKESDSIDKMLIDLYEYERDILYPIATERIAIDLDDGVLVNYNKFGKAIKDVAGLNDKATKKKVAAFDWIDVTQIR